MSNYLEILDSNYPIRLNSYCKLQDIYERIYRYAGNVKLRLLLNGVRKSDNVLYQQILSVFPKPFSSVNGTTVHENASLILEIEKTKQNEKQG